MMKLIAILIAFTTGGFTAVGAQHLADPVMLTVVGGLVNLGLGELARRHDPKKG